jgi:hypothetical protein
MTTHPPVTIVILNWNGLADTTECLRSLEAIYYTNCRVIVVDNGSDGSEAQALREAFGSGIEVIENETNLGFAGGANVGIRRALDGGAEYVLLLNNDTTVDPAFLSELVTAAQPLPDLAAACPKTLFYDRRDEIYSTGGRYSLWRGTARQVGRGQADRRQFDEIAERGYADGVCMLIPRPALERVGLLDEDYFMYWEETDWCARARQAGLRCHYIPSAKIWHKAARSQERSNEFQYLYRRNALLFVRKRGNRAHLATALFMHLFVYGPWYFLRHPARASRALAEARALLWHTRNQAKRPPLL